MSCVKCDVVVVLGVMCNMCCGLQGWMECVKCAVVCSAGCHV